MPLEKREGPAIGFRPVGDRPLSGHEHCLGNAGIVYLFLQHCWRDVQRELNAIGNHDVAVRAKGVELAPEILVSILQLIPKACLGVNLPVADEIVGLAALLAMLIPTVGCFRAGCVAL